MHLKRLGSALALAAGFAFVAGLCLAPTASAHAPIEWSDPKADAVVAELPESVKVRFAEEPVEVTLRTIETDPAREMDLEPVKIAARTYEAKLPDSLVTRDDGTVVIFIETLSTDGHKEGGVYLLHVKDESASTITRPTMTSVPRVVGPAGTTPTAVFAPPASQSSQRTLPTWLLLIGGGGVTAWVVTIVHRARTLR